MQTTDKSLMNVFDTNTQSVLARQITTLENALYKARERQMNLEGEINAGDFPNVLLEMGTIVRPRTEVIVKDCFPFLSVSPKFTKYIYEPLLAKGICVDEERHYQRHIQNQGAPVANLQVARGLGLTYLASPEEILCNAYYFMKQMDAGQEPFSKDAGLKLHLGYYATVEDGVPVINDSFMYYSDVKKEWIFGGPEHEKYAMEPGEQLLVCVEE